MNCTINLFNLIIYNISNKSSRSVIYMKKIKLDNFELKVIINSLNELRTKLLNQNKETDIIDELLLKYINVLEK